HEKILQLPDDVEVYPAHGAGSMCGKNLSKETSSTIGEQRKFNYALKPMSKEDFVKMMTGELADAPPYFPKDAEINRGGAVALGDLQAPSAISAHELNELINSGQANSVTNDTQSEALCHIVLDVRSAAEFGAGHVPGSLNIGLGGQFAMWAGSLIPLKAPIILVANSAEQVAEAQTRLARVGIENVKGYLQDGTDGWAKAGYELATVPQISVAQLDSLLNNQNELQVLDVRRAPEYEIGHVPRAVHAPLTTLESKFDKLSINPSKPTAVICAGGYRSSAATSILQQHGFTDLLNVTGGTNAWINAGLAVEVPPKN
ncbi:MAG TPA: rhodanese-like domain-containing protein, partial [Pyrinomonadaceae bacterium]|nr:rhodanese-like domain-containing protein [Pyrinomonadaceae bacterium]